MTCWYIISWCPLIHVFQQWRSEVDEKREVFHALEDELQKAKAISDEMFKTHKERDLDFDWHKEKADQLVERWQSVHVQIDNRWVTFLFSAHVGGSPFVYRGQIPNLPGVKWPSIANVWAVGLFPNSISFLQTLFCKTRNMKETFSFLFKIYFILCAWVSCLHVCMLVFRMHTRYSKRQEEGIGSSGTGVTVSSELLYGCWEPNLSPMESSQCS